MKKIIRPPALLKNSKIGIFTPSSPANVKHREKYQYGIEVLTKMGFEVVEGELTKSEKSQGYRSGSPKERADEFMNLIRDNSIKALISTIGGANSSSLIPYLDFDEIRANPKIICGYSDVTSLHLAILAYSGLSTFYGPAIMPSFGEWPDILPETKQSFLEAVQLHKEGKRQLLPPKQWSDHLRFAPGEWKSKPRIFKENKGWKSLNPGSATGNLIVANLNTLMTAAGTDYFPHLEGKILLIEEMNAPLAEEERDLRHLERLGVFEIISGLIVSKPEVYDQQDAPFDYDDLVLEIVGSHRSYPIISQFDCGHTNPTLTLAEMCKVSIDAGNMYNVNFLILEPMVC
ncbi:MAG: LD-carboxypeptidase [Bdellovibrionales bacterium]|nr:LD-carboxypeptidase [Bdellovibrionales bacterium]